jgi:hypothetical protein
MPTLCLAFVLALVSSAPATLVFDAPKDWASHPPASSMHVADFTLAKVAGDPEDAALSIFFFGANQGGNVQANVDRWIAQMNQPDGSPSKDHAKTSTLTSHGLTITLVDVTGTFTDAMSPRTPVNKPNFRQIAAVIETPGGPYFVKCTGPQKTIAKWESSVRAFLETVRYE